jgi:hypothetical protein
MKTKDGVDGWVNWLRKKIEEKKSG